MPNEKPRAWGALALLLMLLGALAGCANDAATVNRVQPNLIDKSMFEGAWYVRQTIVDVPPTSGFSFVGMTGQMEMIRWEIREELLVGYRSYELFPGSDPDADQENTEVGNTPVAEGHGEGYDPSVYRDNPIVAYPITEHVDVRREYNAATGEQTNVVSENTDDRVWHQRQFMRVDWTSPKVMNFNFLSDSLTQQIVGGSYWVDNHEDSDDAFYTAKDDEGSVNYFDFTTRLFVNPGLYQPGIPACWLSAQVHDCSAGEVAVRTSFLRVDEERERAYEPLFYDDQRLGEFGMFRTERRTYDRKYGIIQEGVQYFANRHDIWERSLDEEGEVIPFKERQIRPIVYALSAGYPENLYAVTDDIAAECDRTFKKVAATARGQTEADFQKDLEAQTGGSCLFCIDRNEDRHARVGDLRHNFFYWVDSPQVSSPLGYGPSVAHPETGRIVSGTAFVYGAAVDRYAQTATDMIRLMNGDVEEGEFTSGADVSEQLSQRRHVLDPRTLARAALTNIDDPNKSLLGDAALARRNLVREAGFPKLTMPSQSKVAEIIEREGLGDLLITPEMRHDYAVEHGFSVDAELPEAEYKKLFDMVANPIGTLKQREAIRSAAERRSITLADYNDPGLVGLAEEAKKMGLEGDKLWQYLREQIYKGVMLHELGHTFGLSHNFGASADALNFFPEFWKLREKTLTKNGVAMDLLLGNCSAIDASNEADCEAQRKGKMSEYQYSSIMDYGARFNSDFHGFGAYDVAALGSVYGDLVEVFDPTMVGTLSSVNQSVLRDAANIRSPLFGQLGQEVHYSLFPTLFGSADNMQKRAWMPRSEYIKKQDSAVRVPYVGCYDDLAGRVWFCNRWDQGADPYEIADFYINSYETNYYFNNYARGRVGYGPFDVYSRSLERYFFPLTQSYQNAFFDWAYGKGDASYQRMAELTMVTSLQELWSVISRPNYGSFELRTDPYEYYDNVSLTPGDFDYSIMPGEGRSTWSRYDLTSGYNLHYRMKEVGHLYEQMAALAAITSADASRLGIGADVVGGDLQYSIPFYLIFNNELIQLFGSMFVEDSRGYGPRIAADGTFYPSALEATQPDGSVAGIPVDPDVPWTIRIQSAIYALVYLRSNYDLEYAHRSQVAIEGSGDVLTPAANYTTVRYEDPVSGRIYQAYRDPDDTGRWPAAEQLEQLMALRTTLEKYETELEALPNTTDAEKNAIRAKENQIARVRATISSEVEEVEMLRELYNLFGRSPI